MSGEMQADVGRNWIAIAAVVSVVLIGVGYVAWTYFADDTTPKKSVVAVNTSAQGSSSKESEHYQKVLKEYNSENAEKAQGQGQTYVSVISTRAQPVEEVKPTAPVQQQPPAPQVVYVNQGNQQQNRQEVTEQERARQKLFEDHAKALLANWVAPQHSAATVAVDMDAFAMSINVPPPSSTLPANAADVSPSERTSDKPVVKIIEDYARIAALLETNIDTDENSLVVAFVPSGPYQGLTVYATGYKRLNESVDMTFTAMKWKGKSYNITAKAIDKDSLRSALSGEVNNRYFTRIILPAIAAGIGKTGQLYEQSNSQNIITPQGGVIQTYPSTPDGTAVLGSMIGGAGEQAGKVLAQDAAQIPPKQVLIPSKETIGIQFIGPVLSSDEIAPGAAAALSGARAGETAPSQQ